MEHPENSEEYKGLTVNKVVEQPSSINPYLNLRKKPKAPSVYRRRVRGRYRKRRCNRT